MILPTLAEIAITDDGFLLQLNPDAFGEPAPYSFGTDGRVALLSDLADELQAAESRKQGRGAEL